jgi:hypothetical protein
MGEAETSLKTETNTDWWFMTMRRPAAPGAAR